MNLTRYQICAILQPSDHCMVLYARWSGRTAGVSLLPARSWIYRVRNKPYG